MDANARQQPQILCCPVKMSDSKTGSSTQRDETETQVSPTDGTCVFQDWQERYIHPNYTRIMKDQLIETVSSSIQHTHTSC